ncbi:MAG: hypothetical protein LBE35_00520 [Clostridiales bacterium]|nr:hypothetical protein [Clostridiales bacterium]
MTKMLRRHVVKLIFRLSLLIAAVFFYFRRPEMLEGGIFLWIIWLPLVAEMLFRLVPNKKIAMGARKHFRGSFAEGKLVRSTAHMHRGAILSGLGWLTITAAILLGLHLTSHLSFAAVLLLMLLYSILDLIFIIFFCPLRVLFMRNFCCTTCRIYNWDYFMMCAPLILFPSPFSLSLVLLSAAVVIRWEISLKRNPEFFSNKTNANLRCDACSDKLCHLRLK